MQPRGLSLEAQGPSGDWVVVSPDLGFPAGKNKTILIDLRTVARAGIIHPHRLRLRTNLEIYWDALAVAVTHLHHAATPQHKKVKAAPARAKLEALLAANPRRRAPR